MSKTLIATWFNKIGSKERNRVAVVLNGVEYTPQQIYDQVTLDMPMANQLQSLVEQGRYGTTPEEELHLLVHRLTGSLQEAPQPDKKRYVTIVEGIGPQEFSPNDLIREIEGNTKVGQQWINAEKLYLEAVLRVR